ncbi:MAG: hypothetical protein ACI4SJ_06545 [Candidatus Avispirillum sp.]
MPLHLEALTNQNSSETLAWILQEELQNINDAFAQSNKRYFLGSTPLIDKKTGKQIGKYVFTFFSNIEMQRNEILDLDIVLDNDTPVELSFSTRLKESSDSNEYYEAVTTDTEQHLVVETVNRFVIESEIEKKNISTYASAFPYELTVFDDEQAFNKFCGFEKAVEVANTGMFVHGLGTNFIAPGGVLSGKTNNDETPWSFVVGVVEAFSDITIAFGDKEHAAYIIYLNTAIGILPTLAGKEMFDTRKLSKGKIIGMNAYIKANFIKNKYPQK